MSLNYGSEDAANTRCQVLAAKVERAINEADPIGLLETGAPADEYAPEIGTIVPRLVSVGRPEDVAILLHEEFVRWFGDDTAGPRHAYAASARRIWEAVKEYRRNTDEPGPE